jgi:hypothetical protein
MRILALLVVVMLAPSPAAGAGDDIRRCVGPPVLTFSLAADRTPPTVPLGRQLQLEVEGDESGWELAVYKTTDVWKQENLLYPIRWHGMQSLQITPLVNSVFPRERVIKVRTTAAQICVRIRDPRLDPGTGSKFTAGTVEVRWSAASSKKESKTSHTLSRP